MCAIIETRGSSVNHSRRKETVRVVLLAAGLSSRMKGTNKLLLKYRETTIFEEALKTALSYTDDVIVVTGHERERLLPIIDGYKVEEVFNPDYEKGQESSIDAAIRISEDALLFSTSDLPLLTKEHYIRAENALSGHLSARPIFDGTPGHPVALSSEMVKLAKKRSVPMRTLLKKNGIFLYPEDRASVCDIDTPEAYEELITGLL